MAPLAPALPPERAALEEAVIQRYSRLRVYARLRPKRLKPRKGQVDDPHYRAWIHTQPCIVHGEKCRWVEQHHVGRPRNDYRSVPLCEWLHRTGPDAVTTIGQRRFEAKFGVSFAAAIAGLNEEYRLYKARRAA